MDIYQLFEQTAALQFACLKLQNGLASEDAAVSKEDLRGRVLQILDRVSGLCEAGQTESLEELFAHFESIFEKYHLEKLFDGQLEFVILFEGQRAHLFQSLSKFEALSDSLSRIEALHAKVLNCPPDDPAHDPLSVPNLHFPGHRQIFGNRVLNLIKVALGLAQTHLQHTAVYSQMNLHEKALSSAEKACELSFRIVDRITEIFGFFRQFGVSSSETLEAFGGQISDFALYYDFLKRAAVTLREAREPGKSSDLLWRMSSDATLKQLLQRIQSQKEGPAQPGLSRKLPVDDLTNFHISALVKIPPFLEAVKALEQARFDDKLLNRIALVLTSAIFSIATENRFLSFLEIQEELQDAIPADPKKSKCETVSKEFKLQTNRRFIASERIHLLALDILTTGFPDSSKLAAHFFQSFKKNYSVDIFVIEEEDEHSFSTVKTVQASQERPLPVPEPPSNGPMKFIKISLNKQSLSEFRKKPRNEPPASENTDTQNQEQPALPAVVTASPPPPAPTALPSSSLARERVRSRNRLKEQDFTRSKHLASATLSTKEVDTGSLHLSSVDRFKSSWNGFETQKKSLRRQPEISFSKKERPDGYLTMLSKQKTDLLGQLKAAKQETETSTITKTIDKSYTVKASQTVHPKDSSLKRRHKVNGRNFSSSTDFISSEQQISAANAPERESAKRGEPNPLQNRKHVDRLGDMSTKFALLINESTRDFRAKYEGRIKEKVSTLVCVYPSKVNQTTVGGTLNAAGPANQ